MASLAGGLLTLFVFRRELPHVRWIVGYVLLLWLLFALLTQTRHVLEASARKAHRFAVTAVDYVVQTLYHGLLLFVLPAYYASATLTSVNALFLALLVGLALLATFDPWYRAVVPPRPWLGTVFFVVSVFAALNVALPLIGVPPYPALLLSAWASVAALTPAVRRALAWPWTRAAAATALVALAVAGLAAILPAWIPPAPLFLARATLAWDVGTIDSLEPVVSAIDAGELRRRGLVAYTAIYAPAGLRQPIVHVWRRDGAVVSAVPLSPLHGGRREGFRTYSRKTVFPPDPVGRWSVDVMTSAGQLIGRLSFRVIP